MGGGRRVDAWVLASGSPGSFQEFHPEQQWTKHAAPGTKAHQEHQTQTGIFLSFVSGRWAVCIIIKCARHIIE